MIRVIELLASGLLVIDAAELRRIVIEPTGEIFRELCDHREAERFADSYNTLPGKTRAVVMTYPQALQESSN